MRILIGSRTQDRVFHWEEFSRYLSTFGVKCKVVNNTDIVDGFPTKKIRKWVPSSKQFDILIRDFNPDVILTDGLRHFGLAALKSNIPLIVHLVGDFWSEVQMARETLYKSFPRNLVIGRIERMAEDILRGSRVIMPISTYLDDIVHKKLPGKSTHVLGQVMDPSAWYPEKGMTLIHPCVGLVQKATIWGKTREMLVLKDVLRQLPRVTFYWIGDGPYTNNIMSELGNYPNFKHLGPQDYPSGIRRFLTEIDIYALISGMDASPLSLREAMMVGKPTLATNVGGIPEIMEDGKSGLLVNAGDSNSIVEKISYLLDNPTNTRQMGVYGKRLATENVSGNKIVGEFYEYVQSELGIL